MADVLGYKDDVPHRYIDGGPWNPGWCSLCDEGEAEHTSSEEEIIASLEDARIRWSGCAELIK